MSIQTNASAPTSTLDLIAVLRIASVLPPAAHRFAPVTAFVTHRTIVFAETVEREPCASTTFVSHSAKLMHRMCVPAMDIVMLRTSATVRRVGPQRIVRSPCAGGRLPRKLQFVRAMANALDRIIVNAERVAPVTIVNSTYATGTMRVIHWYAAPTVSASLRIRAIAFPVELETIAS